MSGALATVAVVLLAAVAAFQAALALGAPWGRLAWGGTNPGVLPARLRVASTVAALVVYPLAIGVVLAAAGAIDDGWLPFGPTPALWVLAGLGLLGTIANLASRSPPERWWAPVALGIGVACALLALGA